MYFIRHMIILSVIFTTAQGWDRPFYFIVMADPPIPWNNGGNNSEELFATAVAEANRLQRGANSPGGSAAPPEAREERFQRSLWVQISSSSAVSSSTRSQASSTP